MKVLITGASSFTGYWFVKELAERGHTLTAVVRGQKEQYTGLRKERIERVGQWAEIVWNCSFGDETFLQLLDNNYDVLCHHGAQVENYKSPDFDIAAALQGNTLNARKVMEKIKAAGAGKFVVTGSVFEANEGLGNPPLVAFSPYGLSKTISWEIFRYWSWKLSVPLTKFIIPNPFGPYEEPRFCNFLVQSWKRGEVPAIQTPDYIRDNIHADLLARHYADLIEKNSGLEKKAGSEKDPGSGLIERYGPSGYIESQGAFAARFAREMSPRLPFRCAVRLSKQTAFDEPMIRTNDTLPNRPAAEGRIANWDEHRAWDELAEYYRTHLINQD